MSIHNRLKKEIIHLWLRESNNESSWHKTGIKVEKTSLHSLSIKIVGYQIKRIENKFALKTAREGNQTPLGSLLYLRLCKRLFPSTEYVLSVVQS